MLENFIVKNSESVQVIGPDFKLCPDSTPKLFGHFDPGVAPALLLYSYLPIIFVSLLIGLLVLFKDKFSLRSRLLLGISLAFSVWSINLIFQWTLTHVKWQYFSWEITPFLELLIPLLTVYFVYVFLFNKDISPLYKGSLYLIIFLVLAAMSTSLTTQYFNYESCELVFGNIYYLIYTLEFLCIFLIPNIAYLKIKSITKKDQNEKMQAKIIG